MKQIILAIFFLAINISSCQEKIDLPNGFGYINDEIPSVHIDLRYFGTHNFLGKRVDGYQKEVAILSKNGITALKKVQTELKHYNLSIKIFDSYRPQTAVNHFVRWARDINDTINKQEFYPRVKKQNLFKEGYIASKSGHSRGSTVDLTLVDNSSGKELDMGSAWDFFGKESWIDNINITTQQRANRMLLQSVMRYHGFIHYPKEWWHFTLQGEPFPETYFDFPIK